MGYDECLFDCEEKMEKASDHLRAEFAGIRGARATPGLVENIKVNYYGAPTPLKQLANIGIPEPTQILLKPFDPGSLGEIEKAILKSELGITPQNDGKLIRLSMPPLSEERRKQLVKRAKELTEAQRVAIRNVRRDANKMADQLLADAEVTEDEFEKLKTEVDNLTKTYTGKVDKLLDDKTKELMEV
ncbi:ribosome recycling factor [bacterium]|nr:ribosome recycling factor [bacterium]